MQDELAITGVLSCEKLLKVTFMLNMISRTWAFIPLTLLLLTLSACSSDSGAAAASVEMPPVAAMAHMPPEVQSAPESVAFAYRFAAASPDILQQMPCYCGCAPMGHISNYACFWTEDGELDTHGLNCGICIYIARDVWEGLQKGRSLAEIRAQIDADYGQYGPSTDTPPVAAANGQ
jgi:hypothetical protein